MSQYDAMLKFTDRATAIADAVALTQTYLDDQGIRQFFNQNCLVTSPWRDSQDTVDGNGNPVHHLLVGFFVIASFDHIVFALRDHPALQFAVDRDKMNARQTGMVLKSNIAGALLQDIRFACFAGMDPPWGNWI